MLTYFDTSALMDWLESAASAPSAKAVKCGPQVDTLLKEPTRTCALSELTIIETLNAIHNAWRDTHPSKSSYDEVWARTSQAQLLEAVAVGTIMVRSAAPGDLEHALMLVTQMTTLGRKFRAWDAVHLRMAVQWSRESDEPVELVTSNGDFAVFMSLHPYFVKHIALTDLR